MRLAFLAGFALSPKGTVRARALPLASELVKVGHEVTIFLTPYDNLSDAGREWVQGGVRIRNMGNMEHGTRKLNGGFRTTYLGHARMLRQLILAVRQYAPDLIHVFKPKGFAGAAGTYFLLRKRNAIVLDCDDWEGRGGWNEVKRYPWTVKQYIDSQERWMVKHAPVITVASRVLETRTAHLRGNHEGIYYIPNCAPPHGNELSQTARNKSQATIRRGVGLPEGLTVLYSGHFEAGEDAAFFCRVAARVAEELDVSLVFIGEGPGLPRVKEFFHARPRVKTFFFPSLPHENFLELIRASDVAAFPYPDDPVHRAKCSARIVDYMAMGTAVVTSAVGQNCEYIVDGESGLLARPGDEKDFAAKLKELLRDASLRQKLGENAQARMRSTFTWDGPALQQCVAAYDRALHSNKQSTLTHARCPESFS